MVEWKKLGEVTNIVRGNRVTKSGLLENGRYPVISGGFSPLGYIDRYNRDKNTITIAQYGSAGYVDWQKDCFWANDVCYSVYPLDGLNNRYLYYTLINKQYDIYSLRTNAVPAHLPLKALQDIIIPLPSLSEQERIVGILDTFTSSIENLKSQISLRRKQYEHYRDKLLDLEGKPGVEMKTLGEIGTFIRGNGIQKNDFREKGFGCIHYGQIHARYGFTVSETISKIDESLYKRCKKAQKGDVVLATTSEDAEGVAKPVIWLGEGEVAVSGDAFIYHHNQNGKFMGYQFLTHKFMQFKVKYATGAKVVRISGDNMAKFAIPLPSLEEQSRIVSILDEFEASIKNLEAQLEAREKQYEYYRNKLLTFE
ncbi:MAG: restriction endonuclease subunit S [Bacteroidaceae bacterium]|nr:restriction endonuclease subunit S [Bacteroidaceae bacterium]